MAADKRLTSLLDALAQVAISVEVQPTLTILLDSLHQIVPFDAGGTFVLDGMRGTIRAHATRGFPADFEMPATHGIVGAVLRTGRPRLAQTTENEPDYVAVRPSTAAQLTVPLVSPRGVIGAITLESDRAHAFDQDDLFFAGLFAQQAAVVIERAMLHEQLMRQSRLERDVQIARDILRGLTPSAAPIVSNLDMFGESLTAESVGGDAFDFVQYADGQIGVSISDAMGKGLPAALVAVAHQAMLNAFVSVDLRPRAMFARISELLGRTLASGRFVTAFYGVLDPAERQMAYVNAGHPPPLLVRANGDIEPLQVTGTALAFPSVHPMRDAYVTCEPGDGFVLFTDGVTEAGPSPDQFFETAGVVATLRSVWDGSAAHVGRGLLQAVKEHSGAALRDDATVVVVKFR